MSHGPVIDPQLCPGCNRCVQVCPTNVFVAASRPRKPPIVMYPDECQFHYACVEVCPEPTALRIVHPLDMRLSLRRVR